MLAFQALGDPVRRRILELLAEEGPRASGEIARVIHDEFGISQSAVSQHLKVLRDHELVAVQVDGNRRIYAIDPGPLQEIDGWLDHFRRFWAHHLEALATEVARGKRRRREGR